MAATPVQIVDVLSAKRTRFQGIIDVVCVVQGTHEALVRALGSKVPFKTDDNVLFQAVTEYTWNPDEHYDNSWNLWLWFYEHPDFPIADYVPPPVTVEMVKGEAARRIGEAIPRWMIEREMTGGEPIPQGRKEAAALIRAKSNEIEAMSPIPQDFTDNKYWQEIA